MRFFENSLEILDTMKGDKAVEFFQECHHMNPLTQATIDNFALRKKLVKECEIQGPQIGDVDFTKAKRKQLLKQFKVYWKAGEVKDVHDFAKRLDSLGYEEAHQSVISDNVPFEKMLEWLQEDQERSKAKEDPVITLKRFAEDAPSAKD